jgi:hypothetical protein
MKYQCHLCKKLRDKKDIELKEIDKKGLLYYVCLDHNRQEKEEGMKINDRVRTLGSFGHFPKGTLGIVKKMPIWAYDPTRQVNVWFDLGILLDGDNQISGWMFEEVEHEKEKGNKT